jgi:hypothetical protein
MLKPFALAFLLIGAPCWLRSAQSPQKSWDNLRQLRAGEGIEIVDAKMKSHRGNFTTYTQEGISLREDGREMTIPRAEVASVRRVGESHRRRHALLGLAIGTAGGFAVGLIRGKTYHEEGETQVFLAVWTPIGAGIGATAGAVMPAHNEVTVYRATALRR